MIRDGSIPILGAGTLPYVWGGVRFSVWTVVALWTVGAGAVQLYLTPFGMVRGLTGIFVVGSMVWFLGWAMTQRNPFFPEVFATWLWRTARRAHTLRS